METTTLGRNAHLMLLLPFLIWVVVEGVVRPPAGEVPFVVGLYQTIPSNCGDRLARTGDAMYVGFNQVAMLRGALWKNGAASFSFDINGAWVDGRRFHRCDALAP